MIRIVQVLQELLAEDYSCKLHHCKSVRWGWGYVIKLEDYLLPLKYCVGETFWHHWTNKKICTGTVLHHIKSTGTEGTQQARYMPHMFLPKLPDTDDFPQKQKDLGKSVPNEVCSHAKPKPVHRLLPQPNLHPQLCHHHLSRTS